MLFHFHFTHNGDEQIDDTGIELPNVQEARRDALRALCGIAADHIDGLGPGHSISLRIEAQGRQLGKLTLTFDEVPPDWVKRSAD